MMKRFRRICRRNSARFSLSRFFGDEADNAPLTSRSPCGACRQWIQELAPDAEILIAGAGEDFKVFCIGDLLPFAFDLNPAASSTTPEIP